MEAKLQQAAQDYNQGHFQNAEHLLAEVIARHPGDFNANELLGLVLSAEGKEARATGPLAQAVRSAPQSIPARENLAANYARRGMKELAEKQLIRLAGLDSRNFAVMHNLGEFYIQEDKIAAAVPWLRKAQQIDHSNYRNGYDLCLGLIETGQFGEAETRLQSLLRVRNTAELHSLLADAYEKDGQVLLAGSQYQEAARMDPSEDTVFAWGAELLRHRDLPQAKEIFARGSRMYPHSTRMVIGNGLAEHLSGDETEAVRSMLHAIDLDPANQNSYYFLSIIERIPPALRDDVTKRFRSYAERYPGRADAQYYYAANLWAMNRIRNSQQGNASIERLLERVVALDSGLYDAHYLLGVVRQNDGEYQAAAREFEAAIRGKPSLEDAHYRLALLLYRLGQKSRGDAEMQKFRNLHASEKEDPVVTFLLSNQNRDH